MRKNKLCWDGCSCPDCFVITRADLNEAKRIISLLKEKLKKSESATKPDLISATKDIRWLVEQHPASAVSEIISLRAKVAQLERTPPLTLNDGACR